MKPVIYLIIHNVRSCYNVGSLLRTADAFAVDKVFLTGYTPYPKTQADTRLPHLAEKIDYQIHKSALGAERSVPWEHRSDILEVLDQLHAKSVVVAALEQTSSATSLPKYLPAAAIALIVGREVEGIEAEILNLADVHLQIPMLGQKESLNVASAGAVALYHLRFNR